MATIIFRKKIFYYLDFLGSSKRDALENENSCFVLEKLIGELQIYSQVDIIPKLFFYCDILLL